MTQEEKVLRVYADGVFDNFHIGHSNMFKQCREAFPNQKIWLIAGVCAQDDVEKRKGNPIINKVQPSAPKRRDIRWSGSAGMLTKSMNAPPGTLHKVTYFILRIFEPNED